MSASSRATYLTHVQVTRAPHAVTVILYGNGPLPYRVIPRGSHRLQLDLLDVKSAVPFRVLPVRHSILREIRIGTQLTTLQLVFDLVPGIKSSVHYAVKHRTRLIAVQFRQFR
ncbi:MAG: hypothetical protein D6704_11125 [Nitrospirae bacterium]|nr:MAG: hypothetical protein D6704_11125 [Nitrospirota bacterium]